MADKALIVDGLRKIIEKLEDIRTELIGFENVEKEEWELDESRDTILMAMDCIEDHINHINEEV